MLDFLIYAGWAFLTVLIVALWFGIPCLIYALYKWYRGTWFDDFDRYKK